MKVPGGGGGAPGGAMTDVLAPAPCPTASTDTTSPMLPEGGAGGTCAVVFGGPTPAPGGGPTVARGGGAAFRAGAGLMLVPESAPAPAPAPAPAAGVVGPGLRGLSASVASNTTVRVSSSDSRLMLA